MNTKPSKLFTLYDYKARPDYTHYCWWRDRITDTLSEKESTNIVKAFAMVYLKRVKMDNNTIVEIPTGVQMELLSMVTFLGRGSIHLRVNWSLHQQQIERIFHEQDGSLCGLLSDSPYKEDTPPEGLPL
jgi:hypothetical protein